MHEEPAAPAREGVAIVGMACRFPGAEGLEAFWRLLCEGREAVGEVPRDRFDVDALFDPRPGTPGRISTRRGGFLGQVDGFDHTFFGISPREAVRMDPQQRLLLEVAWEALEDAGMVLEPGRVHPAGVFVGVLASDYEDFVFHDPGLLDVHATTGCSRSVLAGRLSYHLGLEGPSLALDSACSSSLTAVHLACQSLRSGECSFALAGGVNLILRPQYSISFSQGDMLAHDGRCKFGDARADGFARSEGVGLVVLKRLSDALADGNPVYGVILGSAVNHDGRRSGNLMTPSRAAQEALLREAWRQAALSPDHVQYVEMHGTGTPVGDPIEIQALAEVLGSRAPGQPPCAVGTVKTNIGHAEAAAGIAGLIKVALALKHRRLPASLHFETPNPGVAWERLPVRVQLEAGPWPGEGPLCAGVSSFGLSGANGHVVLAEAPATGEAQGTGEARGTATAHGTAGRDEAPGATRGSEEAGLHLLPLSAHSPEALRDLAGRYGEMFSQSDGLELDGVGYTAAVRRAHHDHRLALVAGNPRDAAAQLEGFLRGESRPGMSAGVTPGEERRKLVFVYSGQGSQWFGMALELARHLPAFQEALEQCDAALRRFVDWSLLEELAAPRERFRIETIDLIQPSLWAVQVALTAQWRAWGIEPDAVVGHSMGEVAAACAAGVLSLEDGARVIASRSHLMRRITGQGTMAVVDLPLDQARALLHSLEDRVAPAVRVNPGSTVLSGDRAVLERILADLQARDIFCRFVKVDVAGHSPQLDPLLPEMIEAMAPVRPLPARVPFYSAVLGRRAEAAELDVSYWVRNVRDPVLFWTALERLLEDGHSTFVELSPHPIVLTSIQQGLHQVGRQALLVPSLRREDEMRSLLGAFGALYTSGHPVDWRKLYPATRVPVALPTYPWQRRRFWAGDEASGRRIPESVSRAGGPLEHPLLGRRLSPAGMRGAHYWQNDLSLDRLPWLADHRIQGEVVAPGAVCLEMAAAAVATVWGQAPFALEAVHFLTPLFIPARCGRTVQVSIEEGGEGEARFQIHGAEPDHGEAGPWILVAEGRIVRTDRLDVRTDPTESLDETRISASVHQRRLRRHGLELGPAFQAVLEVVRANGQSRASLELPEHLYRDAAAYRMHPAMLDACFQPSIHGLGPDEATWMLVGIDRLQFVAPPAGSLTTHCRLWIDAADPEGERRGEVRVVDRNGGGVLEASGLRLRRIERPATPTVDAPARDLRAELEATDPAAREALLVGYLREQVARVLRSSVDQLSLETPLNRLGLDSLMAVELKNRAGADLGVNIPLVKVLQGPSVNRLAGLVAGLFQAQAGAVRSDAEVSRPVESFDPTRPFPLSYGQQALWFVYQAQPESAAYNYGLSARIRAAVDPEALRGAFQALVDRHPALRTTVLIQDGLPLQQVQPHMPVDFQAIDARGMDETALREQVAAAFHTPFDLEHGPLVRVRLFSCGLEDHVLSWTFHHLSIDFWSLLVLIDELDALYPSLIRGDRIALPALSRTYADFVRWQEEVLRTEEPRLLEHWKQRLEGVPAELSLPTDRPRPPVQTYVGAAHQFTLDPGLSERLRHLARAEGATLNSLLLAAFQVLMHRYTGQDDLVVGSVTAGRNQPGFEGVVGDFVNPVALRADLAGDPSFRAFLGRAHLTALEAIDHQDYPFSRLVERLQPARDPSRSPLFQVAFVLQQPHRAHASMPFMQGREGGRMTVGGLPLESFAFSQRYARFDLDLMMADQGGALSGSLQYNTDLFDAATIERLVDHFQALLEGIAGAPERTLSQLPILTRAEWRALEGWNATVAPYPRAPLHGLIEAQAGRTPHAPAVVCGDRTLTYDALNRQANQLAHHLRGLGVGPGSRVAICLDRSIDMVAGLLGILKTGVAYVPLDPLYPAERLAYMIEDARVAVVVTTSSLSEKLTHQPAGEAPRSVLIDAHRELIARESQENPPPRGGSDGIAYVIYTSGSTGRPKGVQIPHRALVNFLESMRREPGLTAADTLLAVTTLSFDIAGLEIYLPLLCGAKLVVADREVLADGVELGALIERCGATIMQATPATWTLLIEAGWRGAPGLTVLCGGEAMPPALAEALLPRCAALWNMYGPTETTIWSTLARVGKADGPIPIGRPIANTVVYVLDAHGQPVPPGVAGELYIGGDGVAVGYLDRPELTAERFVEDRLTPGGGRLYRTGDLARFRPDGVLECLGRIDRQVKVRGFRIEPGEIETRLGRHPGVREVVVVVREDSPGDRRLVGYVTAAEGASPTPSALRDHLKASLPDYMVPSQLVILASLPRTPNGKIDVKALPPPGGEMITAVAALPSTGLEQRIAEIWREVLRLPAVGLHDNFFDLGGHSLLVSRVRSRIREHLGRDLTVVDMYRRPTVHALAAWLEGDAPAGPSLDAARSRAERQVEAMNRQRQQLPAWRVRR